jgi:predicted Zn-dependent protease
LSDAHQLALHFAARQCGMEPLLGGHSGLAYVAFQAAADGTFERSRPVFGALRRYAPGEHNPSGATPEEVDEYFITVRAVAQQVPIRRTSMSVPSDGSFLDLLIQGRSEEAERLLEASAEAPTDASVWTMLAGMSLALLDHAAADRRITRALAANDRHVLAWVQLAELRLAQGRPEEAMEAAAHAFRLDSGNGHAAAMLAKLYRAMGDRETARAMAATAAMLGVKVTLDDEPQLNRPTPGPPDA